VATLQILGDHPICRKCGDEHNRKSRERSAKRRGKGKYPPSRDKSKPATPFPADQKTGVATHYIAVDVVDGRKIRMVKHTNGFSIHLRTSEEATCYHIGFTHGTASVLLAMLIKFGIKPHPPIFEIKQSPTTL
jgi:hypothetical protein